MKTGARRGKTQRAGANGFFDQFAHARDLFGGCIHLVGGSITHHVVTHSAMPHHATDVDALGHAIERPQIFSVGDPVPRQPVHDAVCRDVFDRLHHFGEELPIIRFARCERDAAVADHHGGHAMPARGGEHWIPCDLRIEMRVDVDKARRDDTTLRSDFAAAFAHIGTDSGDAVSIDGHMSDAPGRAGAVHHQPVANDDIVLHECSCLRCG
jgi:hypothetical protein